MEGGETLALGHLGGIRGGGAGKGALGREVGGEIGHVGIGEVLGEGRHLRVLAPAIAILDELPVGEVDGLAGEEGVPGMVALPSAP